MHQVGFEPTTPVFERVKTVHALDCTATVIGKYGDYREQICLLQKLLGFILIFEMKVISTHA
jgi:hypothetical protein